MTEETILLDIFQPFAQYRNPFTFYYAQTFPLPPKSTIVGMLQNATNRYYDEEFLELKISIHGGFETTFWNYQQLIKGDIKIENSNGSMILVNQDLPLYGKGFKSQRSPISQQELFNGHISIFIRGKYEIIDQILDSLKNPRKILFLGRSEDVVFIKKIKVVEKDEVQIEKARRNLWLLRPTYLKLKNLPIRNMKYPVYSIPLKVSFKNNGISITNKCQLSKETERDVEFETVIHTRQDYIVYLKDEIEVENYSIENHIFNIPVESGWL